MAHAQPSSPLSSLLGGALLGLTLASAPALAWDDHSLLARTALGDLQEIADFPEIAAEPLEAFLAAEEEGLAKLLAEQEAWAQATVPTYPPLPEPLIFAPGGEGETLRTRFLEALRMAPNIKLALYTKAPMGSEAPEGGGVAWADVTTLQDPGALGDAVLLPLAEGERVAPLEVLLAACDEPDYGFDLGIWTDNDTDWGPRYGMGTQPFGDPTKEYSSQGPIHMGLFHEAGIVYSLASFLERTYPELRVHQFASLARYAFETGHDYWGWRFTGWALHYVQDQAMPYHTRVLPGVSVARMLWINTLSVIGIPGPVDRAVRLVSNRHIGIEHYVRELLEANADQADHPFRAALADDSIDAHYGTFDDGYLRHTVTAEAAARADGLDRALERHVPKLLVSDPAYIMDETEPDVNVYERVLAEGSEGVAGLEAPFTELLGSFGAHSRIFVRTIRDGLPVPEPLPEPIVMEPVEEQALEGAALDEQDPTDTPSDEAEE
jgi:hypothetical protein